MSTVGEPAAVDLAAELQAARQRVGELEALLAQKEEAMVLLGRRLADLEAPHHATQAGFARALAEAEDRLAVLERAASGGAPEVAGLPLDEQARVLAAELAALRATRTFRWSERARAAYARLRPRR